jgi:DNA-binding FrmR family transcriptional regulator
METHDCRAARRKQEHDSLPLRRIRGQVDSIARALDQKAECSDVLHNISACRGAMDALMAEVIEGHSIRRSSRPMTRPRRLVI